MEYSLEELQFAVSIRELAAAMKSSSRPTAQDGEWKSPEFLQVMDKWEAENPLSAFVPAALGRIKEVADIIRINLDK